MDEKRPIDAHGDGDAYSPLWYAMSPMTPNYPSLPQLPPNRNYTVDEKSHSSAFASSSRCDQQPFHSLAQQSLQAQLSPTPYMPSSSSLLSSPSSSSSSPSYPYTPNLSHSRGTRRIVLIHWLKPWVPFILYALTSLGFVLAITMYKTEVFQGLDDLAIWLRKEEYTGHAILFALIFITTIPPVPLYSTLTILSGYTFGAWPGAVLSYCAALTGAVVVFWLFRTYCRGWVGRCLLHNVTLRRVVRAIEKRPQLLFLIRLAPYPYNVMNALLAGSPTLTFRTYFLCTALSLLKVIIHTSVGSSIRSFAEYHSGSDEKSVDDSDDSSIGQMSTIAGIALCVAITGYLSYIARKAIDDELGAEDLEQPVLFEDEETVAFLPQHRPHLTSREMGERPSNGFETPALLAIVPPASPPPRRVSLDHQHLQHQHDVNRDLQLE